MHVLNIGIIPFKTLELKAYGVIIRDYIVSISLNSLVTLVPELDKQK